MDVAGNAVGPSEAPLAVIQGIQFGLLTSSDVAKLSVYHESLINPKDLADHRLGLPTAKGSCGTCGADHSDQCQGHFAHCALPQPIFHPNHIGKLVALLRKVCLSCGQLKKKKAKKTVEELFQNSSQHNTTKKGNTSTPTREPNVSGGTRQFEDDESDDDSRPLKRKRRYAELYLDTEARVKEEPQSRPQQADKSVIVLSSDDEESNEEDDGHSFAKALMSSGTRLRNLRKRKMPADSDSGSPVIDLTNIGNERNVPPLWHPPTLVAQNNKKRRMEKGKDPQSSASEAPPTASENVQRKRRSCVYCTGSSARYPELTLKVEVEGKDEVCSKTIRMQLNKKDLDEVAPGFWNFVEPAGHRSERVKSSRALLPLEALKILKKIPKDALARLGMHPDVAWPEALILENVPVAPTCTRILDDAFGITNLGLKLGVDRATLSFSKLLNKISNINKARFRPAQFEAAGQEARELQSLFGQYLREKGAPKAVPGKEKKRIDHVGRVEKRDSRWSLDWLKRHVLGKRGSFAGRNVLTGDPFLKIEEIGIPQVFAKHVSIPERVNRMNIGRLQDCVNFSQTLTGRYRACGAARIVQKGETLEVTKKTSHMLEDGDIVHRHLKDGDLVYVNRPPSLHKHSLLALKVQIQDTPVFTINPAVCTPLHADFDGDCLHMFVPQSEEARAELHQLMTIREQILPSPEGKAIIGMSQDNILATHLMTSCPLFLVKEEIFQISMWSKRERLPVPAIVKSPQGPMWTGKQVIDLMIPKTFSYSSEDGAIRIENGELQSYGGKGNWLTSTSGLVRALAQQDSQAAVDYLNCCQSALREWLFSRGFSVSLEDFYAAPDPTYRNHMIHQLKRDIRDAADMAVNKELIFDEQYQTLDGSRDDEDDDHVQVEALEDVSIGYFQQQYSKIGEGLGSTVSEDNQLLAMVRSGSKGSLSKVLQQMGCLGLQLSKGEHLLSCDGDAKLSSLAESMRCEEKWEAQGLVKSSLLDGLDPLEFFLHVIAVRAGLLRQSMEVTEPGELFKNLMLFLRDVYVGYDGTVRSKCRQEIVQFSYNGVQAPSSGGGSSSDTMPGEAVGILAATSIAQPAYQVMLEANQSVGAKKIRPLQLLQDTIFRRRETKLKPGDRRSILRLKNCSCSTICCNERRALHIKGEIQPMTVEMFATALSITYVPAASPEWIAYQEEGKELKTPYVGHIAFDRRAMLDSELSMEKVVQALEAAFSSKPYIRVLFRNYITSPKFFFRDSCDCMGGGPCLHFYATKRSTKKATKKKSVDFLASLREVMMPLIREVTVKGNESVESVKIIWEEAGWFPPQVSHDGKCISANADGELVVEVTILEKVANHRGSPWSTLKEVCHGVEHIDWHRSAPYSIQEISHSFGVEAARDCIFQRLTLATQSAGSSVGKNHLLLVSDLMVRSGEVIAITASGYKDLLKSLKTSAPFTAGAFRAPMKTFMEAGEKGDEESLSGVVASNIFGKRVPIGTGADFTVQMQPTMVLERPIISMDMVDTLVTLTEEIKEKFPESDIADNPCEWGEGGEAVVDRAEADADAGAGDWNASPNAGGGGWEGQGGNIGDDGFDAGAANPNAGEWGGTPQLAEEAGGWDDQHMGGSLEQEAMATETTASQWGGNTADENGDAGGWGGSPSNDAVTGGWGAEAQFDGYDGELSTEIPVENVETDEGGGWGSGPAWGADPIESTQITGGFPNTTENGTRSIHTQQWDSRDAVGNTPDSPHRQQSSRNEPREFRPTGANVIPLGKVRKFGLQVPAEDPASLPGNASLEGHGEPAPDGGNLELASDNQGNNSWGADAIQGETPAWPTGASEWEVVSVQEGGNEAQWGDAVSCWGSAPADTPTGPIRSLASNSNRGSTSGARQTDGQQGQHFGGARGGSMNSMFTPRRALDSRKDSQEWKDIIETVRNVRNMLQSYEPEERLREEDQQKVATDVLPHHPNGEGKIGCGLDFIKVGEFKSTRPGDKPTKCFMLVRTDGTEDDFSYHKCLQALAAKKDLGDLYTTAFPSRKSGVTATRFQA